MPKIVDHLRRKEELAEAAWRVIRREGLDHVSVRRVADEAGMSLGSLRHYFDTQSELLAFSMRLVSDRVRRRIEKLSFTGDPRRDIEMVIAEILPLDEERQAEAEVWLAFAGKAVSDPSIRDLSLEVHDDLYAGFRRMIDMLTERKLTAEDIDAEVEAKRLHAVVDGLAVHATTFPDRLSQAEMLRIISHHLDSFILK